MPKHRLRMLIYGRNTSRIFQPLTHLAITEVHCSPHHDDNVSPEGNKAQDPDRGA